MRIGDTAWRKIAADVLRGVRRFDREFAIRLRAEMRHMLSTKLGRVCGQH